MSAALKRPQTYAIDEFLARCNPAPLPLAESLRRCALQLDALHGIAVRAAENKMPGWGQMVAQLYAKFERLQKQAAEAGLATLG